MSDDQEFFLRLGRIGDRGAGNLRRGRSFVREVLATSRESGLGVLDLKGRRGFRRSGRGRDVSGRSAVTHRRVVIKARVVRHAGTRYRAAPIAKHVGYLRREGVTKDGTPAEMFDSDGAADHDSFAKRCENDRHHFRFIISPEDAAALDDLRTLTRELMAQAEKDLGTGLDWVAVDHWNTEHPHVHVLVRGVGEDGQDLVIDRDYIARGLRQRAEALVSLELGPRTPAEVAASLDREVEAERWTSLDRKLRDRRGPEGWVDLRPGGQADRDQRRLIGRAQTLEKLGLAEGQGGCWRLDEDLEARLRALGERGDIIKTLHAAWRGERDPADLHIGGTDLDAPLIGRLTDRGLHDELSGQAYVVVDGADGRLHYFRFRDLEASGDTPVGGLVEIRVRQVDGAKAGLELVHRADMRIERQVTASGATWLDRQLVVKDPAVLATRGFGRDVRDALEARRAHLQTLGLADASGRPRPGLLASLRTQELQRVAGNITAAGGGAYSEAASGDAVQGVYQRRVDLASGRFAMIDDGLGFQLVPWTRALDDRLGQAVKGTMTPGGGVDWALGRKRGRGL